MPDDRLQAGYNVAVADVLEEEFEDTSFFLRAELPYSELGHDETMRAEGIVEAYAEEIRAQLELGKRMLGAVSDLPVDVTPEEVRQVLEVEEAVDQAFGKDARLYGRAVALYAIRDLQGTL